MGYEKRLNVILKYLPWNDYDNDDDDDDDETIKSCC